MIPSSDIIDRRLAALREKTKGDTASGDDRQDIYTYGSLLRKRGTEDETAGIDKETPLAVFGVPLSIQKKPAPLKVRSGMDHAKWLLNEAGRSNSGILSPTVGNLSPMTRSRSLNFDFSLTDNTTRKDKSLDASSMITSLDDSSNGKVVDVNASNDVIPKKLNDVSISQKPNKRMSSLISDNGIQNPPSNLPLVAADPHPIQRSKKLNTTLNSSKTPPTAIKTSSGVSSLAISASSTASTPLVVETSKAVSGVTPNRATPAGASTVPATSPSDSNSVSAKAVKLIEELRRKANGLQTNDLHQWLQRTLLFLEVACLRELRLPPTPPHDLALKYAEVGEDCRKLGDKFGQSDVVSFTICQQLFTFCQLRYIALFTPFIRSALKEVKNDPATPKSRNLTDQIFKDYERVLASVDAYRRLGQRVMDSMSDTQRESLRCLPRHPFEKVDMDTGSGLRVWAQTILKESKPAS